MGAVFWYGYRGYPGGRMIMCRGEKGGVGGQGRRQEADSPLEVSMKLGRAGRGDRKITT